MKKDIEIPKVEGVYMAVVQEYNDIYKTDDWNAYIINDTEQDLEMLLVVSRGYDAERETSIMRHKLDKLPAKSYAKAEWMQEDVFALNNEFRVTFFLENKMYDKKYVFRKNSINKNAFQPIPLMNTKGVLVK
ncbi:hypothetical protein C8N46_106294 [Kordia periserrulae]|uniref:Phenylalanyl-tRNA synthetase subunit alpha n=1 Tax=Kordia periserrulae TaxID=701523 RepID=A0A2T6BX48_9FLAO|nr:hypothetical protein [Kordia periserrulae]PTX60648.1 hypothetical protein C8N46_106294 [Kordia periserrulae]